MGAAFFRRAFMVSVVASYSACAVLASQVWLGWIGQSAGYDIFPLLLAIPVAGFIAVTIAVMAYTRSPTHENIGTRRLADGFKSKALRDNIREYIDRSENEIRFLVEQLRRGKVELDGIEYRRLIEILFATKFPYYGIDSSIPSKFQKRHPSFLEAHASKLAMEPSMVSDYRVLMHSTEDLKDDAKNDRYTDFFDWHEEHRVNLLYLPRDRCEAIMAEHGIDPLECTLGIAVWGYDFAMLFAGGTDGIDETAKLTIIEKDNHRFNSVMAACMEIRDNASRVARAGAYYNLKGSFSQKWYEYVNPEERWSRIRPFMLHHLADCKRRDRMILDAASGLGFEFYRLREEGFIVDANEVIEELREAGKEYGSMSGNAIAYEPTGHTWAKIATIGWESRYGAVLVIGNSIRTMESSSQQESINTFYSLLKPGGILVIDERNYDLIEKNAHIINACGTNTESADAFSGATGFERTHNALYHGTNIASVPFKTLSQKGYAVLYYGNTGKTRTLKEAREEGLQEWEFNHTESMESLLKNAGFSKVQKYVDYDLEKPVKLGTPDYGASMYTYVAIK